MFDKFYIVVFRDFFIALFFSFFIVILFSLMYDGVFILRTQEKGKEAQEKEAFILQHLPDSARQQYLIKYK